ncbi:MAG: hypothetical protein N4A35_00380 [Flavobacteriales bacterium]|jgi:carbon monoxide dehydrogenase subunit G|nr:hypothetical protein [Flavobacteriales bacterium]
MTKIESKKVVVNSSQQEVFEFLSDMNNYELLLPKKNISDWKSDEKTCSFKIQKTYKLVLEHVGGTTYNQVNIKSGEGSPFKFTLDVNLAEGAATEAQLICNADINPFLKMMVQKPLNNLFDYMADRIATVKGEEQA